MKTDKRFDIKNAVISLLSKPATKEEAEDLKSIFGVLKQDATKGDVLIASIFNMAVAKGNLSAAKELINLAESSENGDIPLLQQMIFDLKGEN